jgi:GR25 family glycosyltransferase involved in LPS biosynthesis
LLRYSIISVNNDRLINKNSIRLVFADNIEIKIESIDARIESVRNIFFANNPEFKIQYEGFKFGEIGNFASHYLRWKYVVENNLESLLVFEDDVNLNTSLWNMIEDRIRILPEDYDLFSVFVDPNQDSRYNSVEHGLGPVVKGYQDWSTLCYLVSNQGAKKLTDYVHTTGMDDPTDWFIFRKGHKGIFNVYTNAPDSKLPIEIDHAYESLVQKI